MDRHFHDITIGLYEQAGPHGPLFRPHTYSHRPGVQDRIQFLTRAMAVLGGLEVTPEGALRFGCGSWHLQAIKRIFLDAWKLPSHTELQPFGLDVFDKKCAATLQ